MFQLNEQQQNVIDLLRQGYHVFMTAPAGNGKSKCIEQIQENFPDKTVYITSTTGVSALNINGSTLHSFLGIGLGEGDVNFLIKKINTSSAVRSRLVLKDTILVIDEVSMLSGALLTKIDLILKGIRHDNRPFGGIQMLFSADLLQLSPINELGILNTPIFKENFKMVSLTVNYRQETDTTYKDILNNLRMDKLTEENITELQTRNNLDTSTLDYPRIFCTNKEINLVNKRYFNSIKQPEVLFTATFAGKGTHLTDLKQQFKKREIDNLVLKIGTKVMLTKNLNQEAGLINGSMGVIMSFSNGNPVVRFDNGIEILVNKLKHELHVGNNIVATATQLPLIIAYAFTAHKIQGVTLQNAIIDCSNAFCEHQIYVMLSRVKTLDGLFLVNFNKNKIKVNKEVIEFYESLQSLKI